jgi:hypothetical protein
MTTDTKHEQRPAHEGVPPEVVAILAQLRAVGGHVAEAPRTALVGYLVQIGAVARREEGGVMVLTPRGRGILTAWEALNGPAPRFEHRPSPSLGQAITYAQAVVAGVYVPDEVREAREAICATCEHARVDDRGRWCGQCGCGVSMYDRQIQSLAAFYEHLPVWGCKARDRDKGKGWPLPVLQPKGAEAR